MERGYRKTTRKSRKIQIEVETVEINMKEKRRNGEDQMLINM